MKTEVKLGLGLGAILLAVIGAAYVFMPKPPSDAVGMGTGNTALPGRTAESSDSLPTRDPMVITPSVAPGGATPLPATMPASLTPPTTGPSAGMGMDSGMTGSLSGSPATQPSLGMGPTSQPQFGVTPPSSGNSTASIPPTPGPSGPVDWNALLAGSSTSTPGSSTPGNSALPPSVGPRSGTTPGSGLPPIGPSNSGTSGNGTAHPANYTIRAGDTLAKISANVYGSPNFWSKIVQANPGLNPNRLKTGQTIKIPDEAEVKPSASAAPKPERMSGSALVRDPQKEYQVQAGDSLERISQRLYGTPSRWRDIYDLNKSKIGASPRNLKVGQTLKLPTPPSATRPG